MNTENIDISLLVFSILILLCTIEILWNSIYTLIKKKATYLLYERIIVVFFVLLLGKNSREKMREQNLGGNKWKTRGITGILAGIFCLYVGITFLYAAIWQ
jgi:amino acid transporter